MKVIGLSSPAAAKSLFLVFDHLRNGLRGSRASCVDLPESVACFMSHQASRSSFLPACPGSPLGLPSRRPKRKGNLLTAHVIMNHAQAWAVPPLRGLGTGELEGLAAHVRSQCQCVLGGDLETENTHLQGIRILT